MQSGVVVPEGRASAGLSIDRQDFGEFRPPGPGPFFEHFEHG